MITRAQYSEDRSGAVGISSRRASFQSADWKGREEERVIRRKKKNEEAGKERRLKGAKRNISLIFSLFFTTTVFVIRIRNGGVSLFNEFYGPVLRNNNHLGQHTQLTHTKKKNLLLLLPLSLSLLAFVRL